MAHADKFASYEDFKAPWETESGEDAEVDKPKLKRLLFNARKGEAVAQDAVKAAETDRDEAVKAAETERDAAKAEVEKASPEEANRKIAKLESENAALKTAADDRKKADEHEELRKEVIGDLDPKYAKYVQGADRDALEKSLESVKADFDLADGEEGEEGDDDDVIRTRPRSRLRNGSDPESGKPGTDEVDFDAAADKILGGGVFG